MYPWLLKEGGYDEPSTQWKAIGVKFHIQTIDLYLNS